MFHVNEEQGFPQRAQAPVKSVAAMPVQPHPERDADGKLTLKGMRQVIREGGSVFLHEKYTEDGGEKVRTRIIASVSDLPSDIEMAKNNPVLTKQIQADYERQRAQIDEKLAELKKATEPAQILEAPPKK